MDIAYPLLLTAAIAIALIATLALRRQRIVADRRAEFLSELEVQLGALAENLRAIQERARQIPDGPRAVEAATPTFSAAVAGFEVEVDEPGAMPPERVQASETSRFPATRYYYAIEGGQPAVAVPLEVADRQDGPLTVFGRGDEPPVTAGEVGALRPELHAELRRGPSLGDRATFHRTLSLLVAGAHRQERRLAICVLDLDAFKLANERIGSIAGDQVLAEIADVLGDTVGPTDFVFRTGGDEFSVILPGSGRIDAESLFVRLQATLSRRDVVRDARLSLSAGIAQLETDDDGVSLFERARQALQRAKAARKNGSAA